MGFEGRGGKDTDWGKGGGGVTVRVCVGGRGGKEDCRKLMIILYVDAWGHPLSRRCAES